MPNWCMNYINIRVKNSHASQLKKFLFGDTEDTFSLGNGVPMPKELEDSQEDSFTSFYRDYKEGSSGKYLSFPWVQELGIKTEKELLAHMVSTYGQERVTHYEQAVAKCGHSSWYPWSIENWGVKWDVHEASVDMEQDDDTLLVKIGFDSAWSPPAEYFKKLVSEFPHCTAILAYEEPGMCFTGYDFFKEGEWDSVETELWKGATSDEPLTACPEASDDEDNEDDSDEEEEWNMVGYITDPDAEAPSV